MLDDAPFSHGMSGPTFKKRYIVRNAVQSMPQGLCSTEHTFFYFYLTRCFGVPKEQGVHEPGKLHTRCRTLPACFTGLSGPCVCVCV